MTLALAGTMFAVAGCSGSMANVSTSLPAVASSGTAVPTLQPSGEVPSADALAVLLPDPLAVALQASSVTPVTEVTGSVGTGWYAVLAAPAGRGDDVAAILGERLVAEGFIVDGEAGHVWAQATRSTEPAGEPDQSPTPSVSPSPSASVTIAAPAPVASVPRPGASPAASLSSVPMTAGRGRVDVKKAPAVPVADTWVEISVMRVTAPSDLPSAAQDYITVSFATTVTSD